MPPSHPGNQSTSDSEFGELRKEYVLQFPEKARQLRHALRRGDWKELHRLAHRIAGSGSLYGFPELSDKARQICDFLQDHDQHRIEDDPQHRIRAGIAELDAMLVRFHASLDAKFRTPDP